MAQSTESSAARVPMTRFERELAKQAFAHASQDVPLCPISETDPSPILPEESGDGLSPAQRIAIAALIAGKTFAMAARDAGVHRRTLFRWRQIPAFKRVVDEVSTEALSATAMRIRNLMLRATRVLADGMVGSDAFGCAMRVANSGRLWAALNAGAARLEADIASIEAMPEPTEAR